MNKIKLIATIGPGSNKEEVLQKLKEKADYFRINLSHTNEEDIERKVDEIINYGIPVILDTEGPQIRSGNTEEINFDKGETVKFFNKRIDCDSRNMFLTPPAVVGNFKEGDKIIVDFNSLQFEVVDTSNLSEGYIECKVVNGGITGGKKAVHVESSNFNLLPFSKKDLAAVEIAKDKGINHFTLSFMEDAEVVRQFKSLYPGVIVYSKIESRKGLANFIEIAKASDGILIDRGDLSNQVPIEKIPFAQKYVIKKCREMGKEVFVATNTLESMSSLLRPNRAEVNDVINTVLDGATGFALTKEIAVGKYPVETIEMMQHVINQVELLKLDKENPHILDIVEKIEQEKYLE